MMTQARTPEFIDTGPGDPDDEQELAAKCIVMYSTKDDQEPAAKQPKKELSDKPKNVSSDGKKTTTKAGKKSLKSTKVTRIY